MGGKENEKNRLRLGGDFQKRRMQMYSRELSAFCSCIQLQYQGFSKPPQMGLRISQFPTLALARKWKERQFPSINRLLVPGQPPVIIIPNTKLQCLPNFKLALHISPLVTLTHIRQAARSTHKIFLLYLFISFGPIFDFVPSAHPWSFLAIFPLHIHLTNHSSPLGHSQPTESPVHADTQIPSRQKFKQKTHLRCDTSPHHSDAPVDSRTASEGNKILLSFLWLQADALCSLRFETSSNTTSNGSNQRQNVRL